MSAHYNMRPLPAARPNRRRKRGVIVAISLVLLALLTYVTYCLLRPLPEPRVVLTPPVTPALVTVNIPWPAASATEQSAYGAVSYGVLASNGPIKPAPTASVAKVVTALAVLAKKPLADGEDGPQITFTQHDVDLYNSYVAQDGSVVPVVAGSSVNERQALEAMMLPSANNIADSLVNWAFSSMTSYTAFANDYVKGLGMTQTTIADASGFAPTTVSTAPDLVRLGQAALANRALATIVAKKSAVFPGFGTIYNVNGLLGTSGISGIKTGNTDQAGGVFLGAADVPVGDTTIKVITAVMGAPDLPSALRGTLPLVQSTPSQFRNVSVIRAGQTIGMVTSSWGASSAVTAVSNINVNAWTGMTIPALTTQPKLSGDEAGTVSLQFQGRTQTSGLRLAHDLAKPRYWWRLTHPL